MKFDPVIDLKRLKEFSIPAARQDEFAEAFRMRVLDSYGSSILRTAVECLLLGQFDMGKELMLKAWAFINAAIEHKEIPRGYGRGATEWFRLNDLALCNWFLKGRHDLESLQEAVRWKEIWFSESGDNNKYEVQLTLPKYLDAEAYDTLFHRFAAVGLKVPKSLPRIKGEGTMAYVLARHRLGLEYSDEEVDKALHSFLKRNVRSEWIERGGYTTAARWMKIAFWKPGDDPVATFLKCYDYLGDFDPPKYP